MNEKVLPFSQECKFNPLRDTLEVVSGLAVDIDDMLRTGIVKDSSITLDNNGIEDPDSIIGRVRDNFDVLDAERAIKRYGKKAKVAENAVKDAVSSSDTKPSNDSPSV